MRLPFVDGRARLTDEEYVGAFGKAMTDEEFLAEFARCFPMPELPSAAPRI